MKNKLYAFAIILLLITSVRLVAVGGEAIEEEDKVEVPEWNEGYQWRYREKIPMPEYGNLETEFEKEVTDENVAISFHIEDEEEETYETYEVRETHNPDDPEEKVEIDSYHWKENLAEIYNDPEDTLSSAYHPPIVELDFPLYVGKEWEGEARYFEDLGDPEEEPEPDREYEYMGKVENRTVKEIDIGEFETYMVNLTVTACDENETQINRYEMYYSPEAKNVVHTDFFESRIVPDDEEDDEYIEEWIGEKTLIDYNFAADEREPVPDLMVHDLRFSHENISVGETVTISVNVTNIGDLAAESIQTTLRVNEEIVDIDEVRFYQDGEELNITEIASGETVTIRFEWEPEESREKTINVNVIDAEEPEDLQYDNEIEDTIYVEEKDEDEETPGFTSTLLLLAAVIAVAIYKKKQN